MRLPSVHEEQSNVPAGCYWFHRGRWTTKSRPVAKRRMGPVRHVHIQTDQGRSCTVQSGRGRTTRLDAWHQWSR